MQEAYTDWKGLAASSRPVRENTKVSACKGKKGAPQKMGSEVARGETWEATQTLLACMVGSPDPDWVVTVIHPGLAQQLWALFVASLMGEPLPVTPGRDHKDSPTLGTPKWEWLGFLD